VERALERNAGPTGAGSLPFPGASRCSRREERALSTSELPAAAAPLLRGVSHQLAFVVSLVLGALLVAGTTTDRARTAAAFFAVTVTAMFLSSALYHRVSWSPGARRVMRRIDHSAILLVIAGGYTCYGVVILSTVWLAVVLAIAWAGVIVAIVLRSVWIDAPGWTTAAIAIGLGWMSVAMLPQVIRGAGWGCFVLLLSAGALYTAGGLFFFQAEDGIRDACA
jgi:hemolysin III